MGVGGEGMWVHRVTCGKQVEGGLWGNGRRWMLPSSCVFVWDTYGCRRVVDLTYWSSH
jgi:hypothetical protein